MSEQIKDRTYTDLDEQVLRNKGREDLLVVSAVPLTKDQRDRLVSEFLNITQISYDSITYMINSELIAGVRIQSDSYVFEWSARKMLNEINREINESESE